MSLPPLGMASSRIHRQIHDHLLDLAGVGARSPRLRVKSRVTSSISSPISGRSSRSISPITELTSSTLEFQHLLAAEGQQLARERGCAVRGL